MAIPAATPGVRPRLGASRSYRAYAVSIGMMWAMVLAGFWPFYSGLFRGSASTHWMIHVHAAVFSGWLVLFTAQVGLASTRRFAMHRRLGVFGIYHGVLVLATGLGVAFVATTLGVRDARLSLDQAAAFLIEPLGDMVLFGGFFIAGIYLRRNRAAHERLMVLATVALLYPAAARVAGSMGAIAVLVTWLLPLAVIVAHETVTRRERDGLYGVGTTILVVAFARVAWGETEGWLAIGRWLLSPFI